MTIRHVMADGTTVENLEGYLLDKESASEFYKAMEKINIERRGHKNEEVQNS